MNPFTPQETADPRRSLPATEASREPARAGCAPIPFPGPGARRPRRRPPVGEPRGEILLFLGVRYERLAS